MLTLIHALKAQGCYIMSDLSIFYDMHGTKLVQLNSLLTGFLFLWFQKDMVQFDGAIFISLYRMPEFEASWGRIFLWIYRKRSNQGATLVMGLFSWTKFLLNRLYPRRWKTGFCFWYLKVINPAVILVLKIKSYFWQSLILNVILQWVL